jgi:hypothetical protein
MKKKDYNYAITNSPPLLVIQQDQSLYVDCMVTKMSDKLDDQTTHAKVFSIHCYEKQKLMENMMPQSRKICTTW